LHFGENNDKDILTQQLISMVLETEKPDFAAISGDIVSGFKWDNKTLGWYS
jgi:hypothetical protein